MQPPLIDYVVNNPALLKIAAFGALVVVYFIYQFFRFFSYDDADNKRFYRGPSRFNDYSNDDREGMRSK